MKLKKYVKSIIVFFITLLGIVLGILLGIQFLQFFMPFVIGWIIAMIANPLVRILERRLKVARKHTSMVIIIGVLAGVIMVIYFLGVKIGEETRSFLEQAPEMYSEFREEFQDAGKNLESIVNELPQNVQDSLEEAQKDIGDITGQAVGKISQFTVDKAGTFARNIPGILISIIFSILSAYFFIADRDRILEFGRKHTPQIIQEKWSMMAESFRMVFGGYFKAQFKIMAVIGVILFVGMLILKVRFAILVAILVAFLDMLPFLGTGTVLLPWAVFKLLSGDVRYAVGLVILYLVTQLVRRIIEPKLVGDSIGMNPLVTLIFMYIGYRMGGVLGMILAVPVGAIVLNFYKAGTFDRVINGFKEAGRDLFQWMYGDRPS
ncbi:MAG TPA: sporulation integral membrane protein YtvI [Candidatus Blautia stercoripullorum]|uniref:Sporulation integral membrane protein YtvI n=1 Tax=Candidatus Blautia stercoripullorum TaxID=2838502 RepID=A0A9D2R6Y5_9FIRM|nr:sporulation integral membrane protein YtvI [Candidatus Blautia stercoripullorum]